MMSFAGDLAGLAGREGVMKTLARRLGAMAVMAVCLAAIPAAGRTPLEVSPVVAEHHLLKVVRPVYPAIAVAADIEGVVLLRATIGKDGRVSELGYICGPPLLAQAAMRAVKKWRYRPFLLDGHAAVAGSLVPVPFFLDTSKAKRSHEIANVVAYAQQYVRCKSLLAAGKDGPASHVCSALPGLVSDLPRGNYGARDQAYRYAAKSAFVLGNYREAIPLLRHQISAEKSDMGSADFSVGFAYWYLAVAYKNEGNLKQARSSYKHAASNLKRGADILYQKSSKNRYLESLVKVLREYAGVLDKLGRSRDAAKAIRKADKLAKRIRQ